MRDHCVRCGVEATNESIEAGSPLCEEHDSKIKREHVLIRDKLSNVAEQRKTMHLHMSPSAGEKTREHAERRMEKLDHKAEDLRSRLADLRGRCDHPDLEEDKVVAWCPDCGYSENKEWNPEPATLREGETTDVSSHTARNIEQIRQAERDGEIASYQADEAVERLRDKD